MLKINKILSKKIKSPLSLRGAKQRSNLNGFSLIELMVAIAILAMAIFGIFHAYSAGFMGMANARDRTVASNYMREIMEDIKNTDFDAIEEKAGTGTISISGKTFTKVVTVDASFNLKKVSTIIYWDNNTKRVQSDMLVHFIETTAGDPSRIMLIADPYNILTVDYGEPSGVYENRSIITAVIKDVKGNTVNTYSGEITFSIDYTTSTGSGNLSTSSVSANKGIATTTFTASSKGEVIITMAPGTPSTVTATIVDAGGKTVEVDNEIIFEVSGPGSFSTSSPVTVDATNGFVAYITLTSNDPPGGTITVTAIASVDTGVVTGVVDVITGGQIFLSASPTSVPADEKSMITVTTRDMDGIPIKYKGIIDLSLESYNDTTGFGTLSSNSSNFDESNYNLTFNGTISSETLIFTALSEGQVQITATDTAGILTENTLIVTIGLALVPHHIEVYANPSSIQAGGTESSTINARVKDINNITITSYNESVTFGTDYGCFINFDDCFTDGIATAELYPSDDFAGTATITVSSDTLTGNTEVDFYIDANFIQLVANPQRIEVISGNPNACIITATIKDAGDHTVSGYDGKVKFSIISGDGKFPLTGSTMVTVVNGEAQILLQSGNSPGIVKVKATSSYKNKEGIKTDIEGYLNIPVGIALNLVDGSPSYNSTDNSVSFDINIAGAALLLEGMQVSWDNSDGETLNEIEIKSPIDTIESNTAYAFDYYDTDIPGYPASSGDLINIIDDIILFENISKIILYFNDSFIIPEGGKTFDIIFNPNSGNYPVNFTVP
jgi:prepilin-type N-terminal cleavage/methylation domain-containing protein